MYKIYYTYDASDNLISMNLNGVEYYYIRNAQGDIIGLFDKDGMQVVSYAYDSWGKLISIDGSLKDSVGVKNPYRYRGYRYDSETGLYYLQSRYYNPEFGRFVDADGIVGETGDLLGHNMFAYCKNNPINYDDSTGFLRERVMDDAGNYSIGWGGATHSESKAKITVYKKSYENSIEKLNTCLNSPLTKQEKYVAACEGIFVSTAGGYSGAAGMALLTIEDVPSNGEVNKIMGKSLQGKAETDNMRNSLNADAALNIYKGISNSLNNAWDRGNANFDAEIKRRGSTHPFPKRGCDF